MLFDISQELDERGAVFPGDTPFSARPVMRMADGGSCDVSTVTMSVHAGTHADAPSHFQPGAAAIADVPLQPYLGPARVVELGVAGAIEPRHLDEVAVDAPPRLLFKTGTAPDRTRFAHGSAHLSRAAADALGARGVLLVGIDTPSVDHTDSNELGAHRALLAAGVAILENLVLAHVPAGDYELIALPLKLVGLDAAPVRAVLRELPSDR